MPEHVLAVGINPERSDTLLVTCICSHFSQVIMLGEINAPQLDRMLHEHLQDINRNFHVQMLSRALMFLRSGGDELSQAELAARRSMGNSVAVAQMDYYRDPQSPLGKRQSTVWTGYFLAKVIVDRLDDGRDGAIMESTISVLEGENAR